MRADISNVNEWLIMNIPSAPYFVSFVLKQFTAGVKEKYPDFAFSDAAVGHYARGGSDSQVALPKMQYKESAKYLLENISILKKFYADFTEGDKKFKEFLKKVEEDEDYLYENFEDFLRIYDEEYIPGATVDGMLVYGDEFVEDMKKKYPDKDDEIALLTSPYEQTFLEREKKDLIRIAIKAKEGKDVEGELQDHIDSYHWIQNNYKDVEGLDKEYFEEELQGFLSKNISDLRTEYEKLDNSTENHQKRCEEIREEFDERDYEKLLWIGKIASWVDKRKENNLIANHLLGKHLRWICEREGVDYGKAIFLLPSEIEKIREGESALSDFDIEERKKECIHVFDKTGREDFFSGEKATELWDEVSPDIQENVEKVEGTTGWKGQARGKGRIVKDPKCAVLEEGDILITGMTRPEFLPLMKKAAAIVTDEGGITSHAAITAREMKKPCVIGTEHATEIFEDGDLVEVDADKGIVKKLS